ncbi:hypothetical protein SCLCIDRAFT_771427 [Scleroderma citrinum Foug A]|uniref:Uncharacterized protein n=1 Tax=Scleroderma citrinum Foug A TaxID=1036808 RepID=A0A0C3ADF8_9AGAM|nr:hypothetical protein SCLCIDRAFT_771427 [Scleroderma citrinum Foug A]
MVSLSAPSEIEVRRYTLLEPCENNWGVFSAAREASLLTSSRVRRWRVSSQGSAKWILCQLPLGFPLYSICQQISRHKGRAMCRQLQVSC